MCVFHAGNKPGRWDEARSERSESKRPSRPAGGPAMTGPGRAPPSGPYRRRDDRNPLGIPAPLWRCPVHGRRDSPGCRPIPTMGYGRGREREISGSWASRAASVVVTIWRSMLKRLWGRSSIHRGAWARAIVTVAVQTSSNCCYRVRQGAQQWYFRVLTQKWYVVVVVFFSIFCWFIINHCVCRRHRAVSDMLLVTCKWRYSCRFWALHDLRGVPIGALLIVLQQWLLVASVCRTFLVG